MLAMTKSRETRWATGLAGLRRAYPPAQQNRDQRIRSLRRAGMSFSEIGDMIGVSRNVVAGVLFRSGKNNVCN